MLPVPIASSDRRSLIRLSTRPCFCVPFLPAIEADTDLQWLRSKGRFRVVGPFPKTLLSLAEEDELNAVWEAVRSVDDWYDGPRQGVADYRGLAHYYQSVYLDTPVWDPDEDRFELTPLPEDAFLAALELQAIWQRWYQAHKSGTAPEDVDDERVLPADRHRRNE